MSHHISEDHTECPLCMEPFQSDEVNFFPCTCGYKTCCFCWHHIRNGGNGLCPSCRKPYTEEPAEYTPLTQNELQRIKKRQSKEKQKVNVNHKNLSNMRVIQRNLVSVAGLPHRLADPEMLKGSAYFGKFGKIQKVIINGPHAQRPSTVSVYITYIRNEDALRAMRHNIEADGRRLKISLGTARYCTSFLKHMQCLKPNCVYLHELGDEAASFTIEDMQANKHHKYIQTLLQENNPQYLQMSATGGDKAKGKSNSLQRTQGYGAGTDPRICH